MWRSRRAPYGAGMKVCLHQHSHIPACSAHDAMCRTLFLVHLAAFRLMHMFASGSIGMSSNLLLNEASLPVTLSSLAS